MYDDVGSTNVRAQLADARLFVSGLQVRDVDGEWVDLELEDSIWQRNGVALLDFEDGTGACADSGTDEMNQTIYGNVPTGDGFDGLRFQVGVPFALNHNDNATAPPPFNVAGMFWNWRGGYKFVRVDWTVDGGNRWNVHIGSTGCGGGPPTVAPDAACARSNVATIELTGFDPRSRRIEIDFATLIDAADLTANVVDSPPGCMSNPMESSDCNPVFNNLGLDFDSGACIDGCVSQAVFR